MVSLRLPFVSPFWMRICIITKMNVVNMFDRLTVTAYSRTHKCFTTQMERKFEKTKSFFLLLPEKPEPRTIGEKNQA